MPSAISVNVTDTFEQWRIKTNQISVDVFDAMRNLDEDASPRLGGDLYLDNADVANPGSYDILGTGNINITGDITSSGDLTTAGNLNVTGGITAANFVVNPTSGNITGTNWNVDGVAGEIAAITFKGMFDGTIHPTTTGTTYPAGTNSTEIATTAYTDNAVGAISLMLSSLTDTTIVSPAHQHLLMYNSGTSKWENQTILGAGVPNQQFTVAMAVALGY